MRNPDLNLYRTYLKSLSERSLTPPEIRSDVPARYLPAIDDYTMSGGIARTPGGRLWLAWFGGGDDDRGVMLAAASDDNGETFSAPRFLLDGGYIDSIHRAVLSGNLWSAPDGRLFWFFAMSLGWYDGRAGTWYSVCDNPDADNPQWSLPTRIWHGAAVNDPTVLTGGTWLLPVSLWTARYIGIERWFCDAAERLNVFPELDPERRVWIFASTDNGKSWHRRGGAANLEPTTFDEPMLAERRDGSLLMLMRTNNGISRSESFDGGETWSAVLPTALPAASARFFLLRLVSGNLLLVRNSNPVAPEVRSHLTAWLSDDGGASWTGGLPLDERVETSYPDGFQAPDGTIFVQYDRRRECGEILLATFTEEDVRAGRNVSGRVRLKHPLVRSRSCALGIEPDNHRA